MQDTNQTATSRQIVLGAVHTAITFPSGKVLNIKRLSMSAELRFIGLFQALVEAVKESKGELFAKIREYMNGAHALDFGLVEGLEMAGQLFGHLPKLQAVLVDALLLIVEAQKADIPKAEIESDLSTADCLEILAVQADVQGLLGSFRGIVASLGTPGPAQQ